jgi:hypothetical protein
MKQYLTFVSLAILTCPVLSSQQNKLRGGNPIIEQEDATTTDNAVVDQGRHHRVLSRDLRGKPKVVQGKLGKIKKANM